jgi:hypothetical protein
VGTDGVVLDACCWGADAVDAASAGADACAKVFNDISKGLLTIKNLKNSLKDNWKLGIRIFKLEDNNYFVKIFYARVYGCIIDHILVMQSDCMPLYATYRSNSKIF